MGRAEAAPATSVAVLLLTFDDTRADLDALAQTASDATEDVLVFLAGTSEPLTGGWLARLVQPFEGASPPGMAVPALLHPARPWWRSTPDDLSLREVGLVATRVAGGAPGLAARRAGEPVDAADATTVDAASGACVAVDRAAFAAAGGLIPLGGADATFADLSLRLRRNGFEIVTVPDVVITDDRPVRGRADLAGPLHQRSPGYRAIIERHGPHLARAADERSRAGRRSPSFAILVTPWRRVADRWGDWHLAHALARSLERQGHDAVVVPGDEWDDPVARSADIQLVVRGLRPAPEPGPQRQILWVISHPETVDTAECEAADLVLVASERFAGELSRRSSTPVEVMLQATDHRRFAPRPPAPEHSHPLAVVAKTREEFRPAVAFALEQGLRPAIYGSGWESLVDRRLIVADHVPNEQLPLVYSSVGVLLNDHWESMRRWGFVSNRLFDALACGTTVVSDHLPEIASLFGDAVPTFETAADLRARVEEAFADPETTSRRVTAGRSAVLEHHTFDHRALQLLDAVRRHRLAQLARLAG